jgi:hypothetical protein
MNLKKTVLVAIPGKVLTVGDANGQEFIYSNSSPAAP